MGVNLTPIIVKNITRLEALTGVSLAVDTFNVLHQFLALIRTRDGSPLSDNQGRITSHLVGLVFRTTRLISDYKINPIFVFDGKSPQLKKEEMQRRRQKRSQAEEEYLAALDEGDYSTAFSKAVQTGKLTTEMIDDSKKLLDLLGVPWVQAPSEGEAQAAYMAKKGDVWATSSRDYDSLLFGTPRLLRYLTLQGQEWLPSKGIARKLEPEIIDLKAFLTYHGITRKQLIDIALLIGTDFNQGVKGIGPKTALRLIKEYGSLEHTPSKITNQLSLEYQDIRQIFFEPEITDQYDLMQSELDEDGLYDFLCENRAFSRSRVESVIERVQSSRKQKSLNDWFRRRN